jgi:ribosome-associated protein
MAKTNASSARARKTTKTTASVSKEAAAKAAPSVPAHPQPAATRPARARSGPAKLPKSVATAVAAARDKKASNMVVLDLRKAGGFTDYFVICTANNARQIGAIADSVRDTLKKDLGERPTLSEGVDKSEWILLDYFNFVVHIFSRDCRSFYGLERLWGNAERIEFPDEE